MALVLGMAGLALAAFIKGAVGFGFPSVATPLMALFLDGKTAIGILILPNAVMDAIQAFRQPGLVSTLKRHAVAYSFGIVGIFIGTRLLAAITTEAFTMILGVILLVFVAINLSPVSVRLTPQVARAVAPAVGIGAGVLGGITNVGGFPLVIYFYALGMEKAEFVRSIALGFVAFKAAQFLAFVQFGLMNRRIFGFSILATIFVLGTFWLGLKAQDRFDQAKFNRAVLGLLALIGVWMIVRALS